MSAIYVLVSMQLKEKFNFKSKKLKSKNTLFSIVYSIIKFAAITGMCFLILFLCQKLKLFSLTSLLPSSLLGIVFTVMLLISIMSATMGLTKNMYYSYDNPVLLTLPCRPTQVYVSKLIVFYIFELVRNMSFMVPLFIAFGIINQMELIYFPWVFVTFTLISMLPVLVGAILSIPMMWFYNFFRQYKRLQFITILILASVITLMVVNLINIIPANIDIIGTWGTTYWQIQDLFKLFTLRFELCQRLIDMIVGVRVSSSMKVVIFSMRNFTTLCIFVLLLIILFIIGMVTAKPLFYKMASKPFEYRKNNNIKAKQNKVAGKQISNLKTQWLLNIRDAEKMIYSLILTVSLPILVFFLNKLFAAMNTATVGNYMSVAFNVLIIMLLSLSSNSYAASIFSKDGRSSYLIKVQPSSHEPLLISKLVINTIFMLISYAITYIVLVYSSGINSVQSLYLILACFVIYLAHLCYSAELDIMNPQIEMYATIGNNENNPNETKSTIMAFLISFAVAFMVFVFLKEKDNNGPYLKLLLIGIGFLILRGYLFLTKIKLYYKEK